MYKVKRDGTPEKGKYGNQRNFTYISILNMV